MPTDPPELTEESWSRQPCAQFTNREVNNLLARAEKAERELATVKAERDGLRASTNTACRLAWESGFAAGVNPEMSQRDNPFICKEPHDWDGEPASDAPLTCRRCGERTS